MSVYDFSMLPPWRDRSFDERVQVWKEIMMSSEPELVLTQAIVEVKARPEHSKLGASGAERWMNCKGSVNLLAQLHLDESDAPDYQMQGVAMHEAAARALVDNLDAWELIGETFNTIKITAALASPIQIYLDYVRSIKAERTYVEYGISSPVHPDFYGTCDFGAIGLEADGQVITIVDLKGGEGILVEVEDNPQIKYYAFGLIDGVERDKGVEFNPNVRVRLVIVQPRGWHQDGPVRPWETTVGAIKSWVHGELIPAMNATAYDDGLAAGEWCRFCPAKLVCPLLTDLFKAAALSNPKHLPDTSDQMIGLNYVAAQGVKMYIKALEKETLARLLKGAEVEGAELRRKKANRVYREGAAELAKAKFGQDAMTPPELKSVAELEKTVPAAVAWVKEFAYTPDTGYTVALKGAAGTKVTIKRGDESFAAAIAKLAQE